MKYQSAPTHHAARMSAAGVQLIDVREADEFAAGSLPEALNVPLSEFVNRYREINPQRPVAVLCRSGARSARAAAFLVERGYHDVTNLEGGLLAADLAEEPRI